MVSVTWYVIHFLANLISALSIIFDRHLSKTNTRLNLSFAFVVRLLLIDGVIWNLVWYKLSKLSGNFYAN
jgi:hypothetical protein